MNPSISLSSLIETVSNFMPELYPGEQVMTAQNLLSGTIAESIPEYFKLMVYMLSNSLVSWGEKQSEFFTELVRTGNIDPSASLKKMRNDSATIQAFLERLYQFEIETATSTFGQNNVPRPLHLITWLLELGQDPDCYCRVAIYQDAMLVTPIQQAVNSGYIELVQLLLRFKARPGLARGSTCDEALVNLALDSRCSDMDKLRMLDSLFDKKFLNIDEMLRAAIELRDTALLRRILQYGPDVTSYETFWLDPARRRRQKHIKPHLGKSSALMMAVQVGGKIGELMLDYILQNCHPAPSVLADASLAAAYGGDYALMLRLDAMQVSGRICNAEGITPLQAAVVGGNLAVCKYLLEQHGGTSTSLLLAAAILGNADIVKLLIEHENPGDPNALLCTLDNEWYDYFHIPNIAKGFSQAMLTGLLSWNDHVDSTEEVCKLLIRNRATLEPGNVAEISRRCYHRCLEVALEAGGDPNDEDESKYTALQCALDGSWSFDEEEGQTSQRLFTIELLIKAGANLRGGEVVRAIDLHEEDVVLCLLGSHGTLNDVDKTGKSCLEAGINSQNDPFLQEVLIMQESPIDAGPFCAAILNRDWDLVRRLFNRADISTSCHLLEGTAVGLAAEAGQVDILNKLLARFTQPSVLVSAILPFRPYGTDIEEVEQWQNGSTYWRSVIGEDQIEGSPLALAALGGHTCCFRELLCRGCSMDRITWITIAKSEKTSDYLELLRDVGSRLNISRVYDSELMTALCSAIDMGKHELMRYLVEVGADVNEYDVSMLGSRSPLQCALIADKIDMAEYLLENGANINAPAAFIGGATALQYAAMRGHIGFAARLIHMGASVNARGSCQHGVSALTGAALYGRLDMLALLLHHGALTTGMARREFVRSIALIRRGAYHSIEEWLKNKCGWTDSDQDILERFTSNTHYVVEECLGSYCCDEYHDSDTQCVYHYTEEQRKHHYETCEECLELEAEAGKVHSSDDEDESSFSSEDGDSESEGNED
ncbi:Sex-determining fem-1 [Fusarium pseudocircinatum]|uniref:Sex-determining fem-1 n=1 Tax=Fusarium pseudocircinatum TaxID=56676 RepID=A0A8H5UYW6_9HYPO|nr:Sex-determining fem-1 [Fusarium pseudocircinatum]